jgi:hypothetical protein
VDDDLLDNDKEEIRTMRSNEPTMLMKIRDRIDHAQDALTVKSNELDDESVVMSNTLYVSLIKTVIRNYSNNYAEIFRKTPKNSQDDPPKTLINIKDRISGESLNFIDEFFAHIDFILPLCLKSIVVRYGTKSSKPMAKVLVEDIEIQMFETFISLLAQGLVIQAVEKCESQQDRENSLKKSISSSQIVVDFLVGLISIIRGKHIEGFLLKYFDTIRDAEPTSSVSANGKQNFTWTEEELHQLECCQQLRLFAAEALGVLPSFLALNLPMKYSVTVTKNEFYGTKPNWFNQYVETLQGKLLMPSQLRNTKNTLPSSGWLVDLVMNECFHICAFSSKCVVEESAVLIEESSKRTNKRSAIKKRHGIKLSHQDLTSFHLRAVQAISIVYELIVRRHSMDQRFQTLSAQGRIAGMLAKSVLTQSCKNEGWLSKLHFTNHVRSTWLLCFIYILQEAPEALIYDFIRSCCSPKVRTLKNSENFLTLQFLHLHASL